MKADYICVQEQHAICPYCKQDMVKHIIKEGARFHVSRWDYSGEHCSEKNCEHNHGPGKCIPLTPEQERDKEDHEFEVHCMQMAALGVEGYR